MVYFAGVNTFFFCLPLILLISQVFAHTEQGLPVWTHGARSLYVDFTLSLYICHFGR